MKDTQILDMLGISGRRALRRSGLAVSHPAQRTPPGSDAVSIAQRVPVLGGPRLSFLASYDGFVGWKETAECA